MKPARSVVVGSARACKINQPPLGLFMPRGVFQTKRAVSKATRSESASAIHASKDEIWAVTGRFTAPLSYRSLCYVLRR